MGSLQLLEDCGTFNSSAISEGGLISDVHRALQKLLQDPKSRICVYMYMYIYTHAYLFI